MATKTLTPCALVQQPAVAQKIPRTRRISLRLCAQRQHTTINVTHDYNSVGMCLCMYFTNIFEEDSAGLRRERHTSTTMEGVVALRDRGGIASARCGIVKPKSMSLGICELCSRSSLLLNAYNTSICSGACDSRASVCLYAIEKACELIDNAY